MSETFYITRSLPGADFDQTIDRVRDALEEQGFGVLTDIDVAATFRKKLDFEFRPYRILGACNPGYAREALETNDKIGALLPCNVIVQTTPDGVEVAAVDPGAMLAPVGDPSLQPLADQVRKQLSDALDAL